jgi:hypothetical protein
MSSKVILIALVIFLLSIPDGYAFIVINEIHATPVNSISGDANNDGVRSANDDEFVELLNFGSTGIDISGWKLSDAVGIRHVFPAGTLLDPYAYLVVFGGGSPDLAGVAWQIASTGILSLNNTADTVTLFDLTDQVIDQIVYGNLANQGQSIVRFPEATGSFILHATAAGAGGTLYSPGTSVDGRLRLLQVENTGGSVVPEPATMFTFFTGMAALLRRKYLSTTVPLS